MPLWTCAAPSTDPGVQTSKSSKPPVFVFKSSRFLVFNMGLIRIQACRKWVAEQGVDISLIYRESKTTLMTNIDPRPLIVSITRLESQGPNWQISWDHPSLHIRILHHADEGAVLACLGGGGGEVCGAVLLLLLELLVVGGRNDGRQRPLLRCAAPLPVLVEARSRDKDKHYMSPRPHNASEAMQYRCNVWARMRMHGTERMRLRPSPIHDQSRPPGFWDERGVRWVPIWERMIPECRDEDVSLRRTGWIRKEGIGSSARSRCPDNEMSDERYPSRFKNWEHGRRALIEGWQLTIDCLRCDFGARSHRAKEGSVGRCQDETAIVNREAARSIAWTRPKRRPIRNR
ncbi:hypothetical protein B0H14DRAFT_3158140 [Mycena olivaceomarginata]|nr:hypothetical protein B0H14DRAFT_3158140 [Mycena olivaceomarginata]